MKNEDFDDPELPSKHSLIFPVNSTSQRVLYVSPDMNGREDKVLPLEKRLIADLLSDSRSRFT
jgi:hypothetical protein